MSHNLRNILIVFAASLGFAAACGDSDAGTDDTADTGANVDIGAGDTSGGEYPAGPYGLAVGDTIENLAFVLPDGTPTSLQQLRAAGTKAIYLNTASGWCTACREEQPAIQALHEELADDGLVVVIAYFEDSEFNPATPAGAAAWISTYSLTFSVVADPEFVTSAYYDESQTPMNLVIEAEQMRIAHISTGVNLAEVRTIINLLLR